MSSSLHWNSNYAHSWLASSLDHTPKRRVDIKFWTFSGVCKLSSLVFTQANQIAALRFSHDIISHCEATSYKVSCANQPECTSNILSCSNMHTGTRTKKCIKCHQTLPCMGTGAKLSHTVSTILFPSKVLIILSRTFKPHMDYIRST